MRKRKKSSREARKSIGKAQKQIKKINSGRKESLLFYLLIVLLIILLVYLVYSFVNAGYTIIKKGSSLNGELPTLLPFFGVLGILIVVVVLFIIKVVIAKKDDGQELSPTIKKTREIMARNPDLSVTNKRL